MYSKVIINPTIQKQMKSMYSCYVCKMRFKLYGLCVYVFVGPHKLSLEFVFTVLMSVEIYTRFKWSAHDSGIPRCSQGNVHFFFVLLMPEILVCLYRSKV